MSVPDIALGPGGLAVDGVTVPLPAPVAVLTGLWGLPSRWDGPAGVVLIWHDLGLYGHVHDDDHLKTLCLQVREEAGGPAYLPASCFSGTFRVDDVAVRDEVPGASAAAQDAAGTASTVVHGLRVLAAYDGRALESVELSGGGVQPGSARSDAYAAEPAASEPLAFADLNLKLAVVDELMYGQGAIEPKFDLDEFARSFRERGIELDLESIGPIPEVLAWFERLEIDRSLAERVESLVVDAGNEVYRHVAPHWDGEDDAFDIGSWDDLDLLPRLEGIDFISLTPDPATIEELRGRGLDIDD